MEMSNTAASVAIHFCYANCRNAMLLSVSSMPLTSKHSALYHIMCYLIRILTFSTVPYVHTMPLTSKAQGKQVTWNPTTITTCQLEIFVDNISILHVT